MASPIEVYHATLQDNLPPMWQLFWRDDTLVRFLTFTDVLGAGQAEVPATQPPPGSAINPLTGLTYDHGLAIMNEIISNLAAPPSTATITEHAAEHTMEPIVEPVADPVVEPMEEAMGELISGIITEPNAETITQTSKEIIMETPVETVMEVTTDFTAKATVGVATESGTESDNETDQIDQIEETQQIPACDSPQKDSWIASFYCGFIMGARQFYPAVISEGCLLLAFRAVHVGLIGWTALHGARYMWASTFLLIGMIIKNYTNNTIWLARRIMHTDRPFAYGLGVLVGFFVAGLPSLAAFCETLSVAFPTIPV